MSLSEIFARIRSRLIIHVKIKIAFNDEFICAFVNALGGKGEHLSEKALKRNCVFLSK